MKTMTWAEMAKEHANDFAWLSKVGQYNEDDWYQDMPMRLVYETRDAGGAEVWIGSDNETYCILSQGEPLIGCDATVTAQYLIAAERTMTREQLDAYATYLEAQAEWHDAYRAEMERTTERTNGKLGHLNSPATYAAHGKAAANDRKRAADLRAQADGVWFGLSGSRQRGAADLRAQADGRSARH
jgi:hypothetical protein